MAMPNNMQQQAPAWTTPAPTVATGGGVPNGLQPSAAPAWANPSVGSSGGAAAAAAISQEAPPAWANPSPADRARTTSVDQHEQELFSAYSTLDEPVMETIMRDVRAVASKLKIVIMPIASISIPNLSYSALSQNATGAVPQDGQQQPNDPQQLPPVPGQQSPSNNGRQGEFSDQDMEVIKQLKDWDLWGPLIVCLGLAVVLSVKAPTNQASLVFAAVFCVVCVGSIIVTVNAQLLGSHISFFQSVCVLGYCIFPLLLAATVIVVLKLLFHTWLWFNLIFAVIGFVWATKASSVFMSLYVKAERRFLALYPLFFFYTFLGWMILIF